MIVPDLFKDEATKYITEIKRNVSPIGNMFIRMICYLLYRLIKHNLMQQLLYLH